MKINLKWLKENSACFDGVSWFKERKFKTDKDVFMELLSDEKFSWANWTIVRLMDHPQKIRYAIYAAEKVIDIFEKKYPEDPRPRKAIEAAKAYLKDSSDKNKRVASAAADAAYDASYAAADAYAAAAADAAYDAAYATADAAYDAADADAAYAAAAYAAAAYAKKKLQKEIIEFGIELLEEKEDSK